ncbi:hypothetical protein GGR53DRAFT_502037 [Hypoxylon sp. FL1150]|nr:hypothetical protein GGR53DRAFT_502037 [Hypoxylon sp. FL1150]
MASTITWTVLRNDLYLTLDSGSAKDLMPLLEKVGSTLLDNLASYIYSWSCLWSIKLSFMAFFHGLGRQIRA